MNTMLYEEAYNRYRQMWEKKLAKGNRPQPDTDISPDELVARFEAYKPIWAKQW